MTETQLGLLGLAMMYSVIHFGIIQHNSNYSERTTYEKVVSIVAIVIIALIFLWTMF